MHGAMPRVVCRAYLPFLIRPHWHRHCWCSFRRLACSAFLQCWNAGGLQRRHDRDLSVAGDLSAARRGCGRVGMLCSAITALLTFAQSRLLGRRSYVTIAGKAFRPSTSRPVRAGCVPGSRGSTRRWRRCFR